MSDRVLPAATSVGRVALAVTDLEQVTAFYADVVGLTVREQSDERTVLGTAATPLVELHASDAPARPPDAAGLFHLALRVPDRPALGAALERLETQWQLTGASDHDVSEALYFRDPDGNGVEIYRDTPSKTWTRRSDGGVNIVSRRLDLEPLRAASNGAQTVPAGTDVGHVHLEVSSIPAAEAFYCETLGFEIRDTYAQTGETDALFVAAGDYHHHLGLNTWNNRTAPASGRGLAWFELVVPDEATLVALADRLDDAGVATARDRDALTARDPDDIQLRVRT